MFKKTIRGFDVEMERIGVDRSLFDKAESKGSMVPANDDHQRVIEVRWRYTDMCLDAIMLHQSCYTSQPTTFVDIETCVSVLVCQPAYLDSSVRQLYVFASGDVGDCYDIIATQAGILSLV